MSTVADKLAKKSSHKTSAKQVRLRLVYIDFWSAVKLSFLAAIAIAIVTVVAFVMVYLVVQTTGLIGKADEFFRSFSDGGISLSEFVEPPAGDGVLGDRRDPQPRGRHGARRRHRRASTTSPSRSPAGCWSASPPTERAADRTPPAVPGFVKSRARRVKSWRLTARSAAERGYSSGG